MPWGTLEGRDNSKPLALAVLWISIAVVLAMTRVAFLAYSVNMLLIKRFTPDTSSLGTTMSLVQICICFSRAISPAFTSATYAFSVQYHIFGGYLWVIIMVLIGLTSSRFSATVVLESSKLYDV
uniref:Uncharacterized protein n=1 Tax=Psilocybe cubensis TaxID=181762 RepID=A0A8H7Y2E3_PSICU